VVRYNIVIMQMRSEIAADDGKTLIAKQLLSSSDRMIRFTAVLFHFRLIGVTAENQNAKRRAAAREDDRQQSSIIRIILWSDLQLLPTDAK